MGYHLMWHEVHQTFHVTLEASYVLKLSTATQCTISCCTLEYCTVISKLLYTESHPTSMLLQWIARLLIFLSFIPSY